MATPVRVVPDPESGGRGLAERSEDQPKTSEGGLAVNGMTGIRILLGAIWLKGAAEKILNPQFPTQFAQSLQAGGFVSQAPPWFQLFMQGTVVPAPNSSPAWYASGSWPWASGSCSACSPTWRPWGAWPSA